MPRVRDWSKLTQRERWDTRLCYEYMRFLFRPDRSDPKSRADVPFHTNKPRKRLSRKKYLGCQQLYIAERRREFLELMEKGQAGRAPQSPSPDRWPDLEGLDLPPALYWQCEFALRRLYFADTKPLLAEAKREVNALAQGGPEGLQQALERAVQRTPPPKRLLSWQRLLALVTARAKWEFFWEFLRRESGLNREQMKDDERAMRAAVTLKTAYLFLLCHLSHLEIAVGLQNPHQNQAAKDTADEFDLCESTIRSLISEATRR